MIPPRLYLDEDVDPIPARILKARGYSDQLPLKELLARILRLLHHHTPDTLHNRVIWLQDFCQ